MRSEDVGLSWSVYSEDSKKGFSMKASEPDSYSGYERDLMKQTMLEHEAVFKNQVHELHRLYSIQRSLLMDVVNRKNSNEDMSGSSSQACNGRLQSGVSSKVKRKVIDLQLSADEYLDTDENTTCPLYNGTNSGKVDASCQSNLLDVNNLIGLADLNVPLERQESEHVALSRGMYNNAQVQGQWLEKNVSQNGWNDRSTERDKLHLHFHSLQVRPTNAFQPQSFNTTNHSNVQFPGQIAYRELEVGSKNPQVSYGSYAESSVASNGPRLYNDYCPDYVRPWGHWSSSWENPMRNSNLVQTSPFMNFDAHARADSSFEMRSRLSNGRFSSGSKESVLNFSSPVSKHNSSFGEPKQQVSSTGIPWLNPKPYNQSEISIGCFDLNASANQFMDGADTGDNLTSVSHQKGPSFTSYSESRTKKDQHKDVNHLVKLDLNINLPCKASVSVDQHVAKAKEETNKTNNFRHYIDLNSYASEDAEDYSLRVKSRASVWIDLEAPPALDSEEEEEKTEGTWGLMKGEDGSYVDTLVNVAAEAIVAISLSNPDDAASSTADVAAKSPLAWFAEIITSCGNDLERKAKEIDYFEAKTLSLKPTKEKDYMPEPLVPENLKFEGFGFNRPRRGQARRGRPKRDFQRDVLPGLSSLSRHEATEDIQLLGQLMKTSDYSARPNSKRKRLVSNISQAPMTQPMNENISVLGLEDIKLTGWGKARTRPRRQKCPHATVIIT